MDLRLRKLIAESNDPEKLAKFDELTHLRDRIEDKGKKIERRLSEVRQQLSDIDLKIHEAFPEEIKKMRLKWLGSIIAESRTGADV